MVRRRLSRSLPGRARPLSGKAWRRCGVAIAYHGLIHLGGEEGAEFLAIFTHGRLDSLDPIVEEVSNTNRCLGEGLLWTRDSW
jgi:hypothetical protein